MVMAAAAAAAAAAATAASSAAAVERAPLIGWRGACSRRLFHWGGGGSMVGETMIPRYVKPLTQFLGRYLGE